VHISHLLVCAACSTHLILLDLITNIWWSIQVTKKLLIMHFSLSFCHFLISPNILLSTLFSNTLILCFYLSGRDIVSYTYKTKGGITVSYIMSGGGKAKDSWTELLQAFPEFYLPFISSWMQVWYVTVPKYLNFATFSHDLLAVSKLWFHHTF
jgi:hypothetical protein